jgi:TRAP-type C4-dicarboxylate transport system substrate-binding protein
VAAGPALSAFKGIAVALVSFTLGAAAGCASSGANKAGGRPEQKPVVLTWVYGGGRNHGADQLLSVAEEAKRLSGGTIRIVVDFHWRPGDVAWEKGLIEDVAVGKAALGAAGSRALDSVGVMSLRALHAPFLIDSYALEARVLSSPLIPKMLKSLDGLGLMGLGVMPGPMRRPVGVSHAFVEPSDYQGSTMGIKQSRVADETMRALGARPVSYAGGDPIEGFGGSELDVRTVLGNSYRVKYVTANVNLWPLPLVLFANREMFESLTSEQQAILKRAVAEVARHAVAAARADDRQSAAMLCGRGVAFVDAREDDLAALRRAVQPVYDRLERDPQTKTFITKIDAMRRQLAAPPDAVRCQAK